MQNILNTIQQYLQEIRMPAFQWIDAVEILIIAFFLYQILRWLRNTRAWVMMRGLAVVGGLLVIASLSGMTTILWIAQNVMQIAVIALIIILQPELRSAIEELGQKDILNSLFRIDSRRPTQERFSDKTVGEIVRACTQMARSRTGALIVIEQKTPLNEIERTGIAVDGLVTSQLLVNIFEKNTPLHDGAVIVRGDRVVSATCYLPLSDTRMDKELGTRHRAGVGVSEVSDALTIIISEENGSISLAYRGALTRDVDAEQLRARLVELQKKEMAVDSRWNLLDRLMQPAGTPADRRDQDGE